MSLKELVDAAKAEGEVRAAWMGDLDEHWRQNFEAAFNRQFGFRLKLQAAAAPAPPATGEKPPWDVVLSGPREAAELARAGRLGSQSWRALFGTPIQATLFDGGAVAFAHQLVQPAYNVKRVPPGSAPTTWEGLLEARWKGRIGVSNTTEVWADLSSSWGEQRTEQFVHGLATLQPARGAPAELIQKLEDGAIDVLAAIDDVTVRQRRERGAPLAAANVQPLLLQSLVASPIRDAAHPNAGILFAGFLLTEEGQKLWQQYAGQSSIFLPGSPQQKLVEGKAYVLASPDFVAREQASRAAAYAKLLGY